MHNFFERDILSTTGSWVTHHGGDGPDTLTGSDGPDWIDGGRGADSLYGGLGDDTYNVDDLLDRVIERASAGDDLIIADCDFVLSGNVERLYLEDNYSDYSATGNELDNVIAGSRGDNILRGKGGNDILEGGSGDDTVIGGPGDDFMMGGIMGNDVYYVDSSGDIAREVAAGPYTGIDTVFSTVNFTLGANIEILRLRGLAVFGTGNELDNQIVGTAGANVLRGGGGNDRLGGRAGDDTISGGQGDDVLVGGSGADMFRFNGKRDGADTILDFSRSEDRIDLAGGIFNSLSVQGRDSILQHAGGTIVATGVTELTLEEWNGLVVPSAAPSLDLIVGFTQHPNFDLA